MAITGALMHVLVEMLVGAPTAPVRNQPSCRDRHAPISTMSSPAHRADSTKPVNEVATFVVVPSTSDDARGAQPPRSPSTSRLR